MPYVKRIVCLANSFKTGGSCIAGKEVLANGYGEWIRPVSHRPTAEVRPSECGYGNNRWPTLLDIIDVPLLGLTTPRTHQTENHVIDTTRRWVKVGELPVNELSQLRDRPASLWINSDRTSGGGAFNCISQEEAATLRDSLMLIRPEHFSVKVGSKTWDGRTRKTYRGSFRYRGISYILQLTDPITISHFETADVGDYALNNVHICVSLTEPWPVDNNRCHKLVAAVFSEQPLR